MRRAAPLSITPSSTFAPALALALVFALVLLGLPGPAGAAGVHKCVDARGKVSYQDAPCKTTGTRPSAARVDTSDPVRVEGGQDRLGQDRVGPSRPATAPDDGADQGFRGAWRGTGQLALSAGGRRLPRADARAPTLLELRPDGSAGGYLDGTGCRIAGRYTTADSVASLELEFTQCRDTRFNRHYSGHLIASPGAAQARLSLHAARFVDEGRSETRVDALAGEVIEATLSATLRR